MMSSRHFEDKDVKARKPHTCFLCGEPITVGEVYRRRTGADDDGLVTMHMHSTCHAQTIDWDWTDWETFEPGDMKLDR